MHLGWEKILQEIMQEKWKIVFENVLISEYTDFKLPGTMSQNHKFIQYMSLLLFKKLEGKESFLKSAIWRLYLHIKKISEMVSSEELSESQVNELEHEIKTYVDIRIALKENSRAMDKSKHAKNFQHLG